jgi:hypothetical protein
LTAGSLVSARTAGAGFMPTMWKVAAWSTRRTSGSTERANQQTASTLGQ